MQLGALLPVVALLAAAGSSAHSSNLESRRVQGAQHAKLVAREETAALHARAAERIVASVGKRAVNDSAPRALKEKPRKKKRGAAGCRARGADYTPSTTAAAAASTAPAPSSAAPSPTDNQDAAASAQPSTNNYAADSNNGISIGAGVSVSVGGGDNNNNNNNNGGGNSGGGGLTPNGIKAGLSGTDMIDIFGSHVGWYWDYTPTGNSGSSLTFMPTLWGNGNTGDQDWGRLQDWKNINWNPQYVQGFYEPDCSPPMSSSIDPSTAATMWNALVVPWQGKGAKLVSPGMCKQADEDWLQPFLNAGATEWDITSIHINKLDMDGAKADIDHYWNAYGKPIWVTEFACVDDQNGFTPSEDQGQINDYINQIVDLLENDGRIYAYSMSEGEGLGNTWPPYKNGQLTESGQTYLNAVSKYH